ncbi:hypothetical protein ACIBHX_20415 [Nonomuraea sp. NPDC050536]|uniref:hypothetical protein n=1 Tax=Nonomuraea sp. NPDC050536 TaxID=3364366 RepID=UPI0037C6E84F
MGRVLLCGAFALASLLTLVEASIPGLSLWVVFLAVYWLALAGTWLAWVVSPERRTWALLIPVALVLGTAVAVRADVSQHARFALSERSLERYARAVHTDYRSNRWWGLYHVDDVEKIPGGARFRLKEVVLEWRTYGFAYSPGRVPDPEEGRYRHLKGPWYLWIESMD